MATLTPVSPDVFAAIQNVDIDSLAALPEATLRPILPCLVRMSLCAPLDTSEKWTQQRKKILKCLSGIDVVNSLVGLLSIDFQALEEDARKEQQMRVKLCGQAGESILVSQLDQSVALEFERTDAARKLRLLLSELLPVMAQMHDTKAEFFVKSSELFENEVYLEEVSDVLCISQAELPNLLPVSEVSEALLHVNNGAWLLCRLLANVPDTFHEVCSSLVSKGEQQDEDSVGGQRRLDILTQLCHMYPNHALTVRALCIRHCRLPGLAVALTLHYSSSTVPVTAKQEISDQIEKPLTKPEISDVAAFVSSLLLSSDPNTRSWFAQFIRMGQKRKDSRSMVYALRCELLRELQSLVPDSGPIEEHQVVRGCAFIRLYCAMKAIATIKFDENEGRALVQLVTSQPLVSLAGSRFISLGLCMLLACPYLLANFDQERTAVEWIKQLLKDVSQFEQVCGENASFGEMILLIAIHFHSNQHSAIAELVSNTLGMKSAVKANALSRLKNLFTQEIFTEQVVTSHAVKVPVTRELNAKLQGYLPIHCVYQLLKSRAFSKHKVHIKRWIFKQLCSCTTPIHSLVPPLIETYVSSVIVPASKTERTNEPLTEKEVLSVFKICDDSAMEVDDKSGGCKKSRFTPQLLMVYYVLHYQDVMLNSKKAAASQSHKVIEYCGRLLAQMPLTYLLHQAHKQQEFYAGLFPPLLKLLVTHYPHLCLVEDWMQEDLITTAEMKTIKSHTQHTAIPCTNSVLQKAFDQMHQNPTQLLLLLEHLCEDDTSQNQQYADTLSNNLPKLLESNTPRKILELFKIVWFQLNTVMPRKWRVMTVNSLRPAQFKALTPSPYREDDLILDPLCVLRCDERIFRCPPILDIILRILEAFLQASRAHLTSHIQITSTDDKGSAAQASLEREELKSALLATQESANIQILLEICLPSPNAAQEDLEVALSSLREVRCLVCSYLHQKFIADPNLAKLVHFQGYPRELLPITVEGIPSMHICLDFIPELLSQPYLEKQVFAVELVSHLCQHYALPKSLSIAKLAITVCGTLLTVVPSEKLPSMFIPLLPAFVRISQTLPPLCDDVVGLLVQVARVCNCHITANNNLISNDLRVSAAVTTIVKDTSVLTLDAKKTGDSMSRVDEYTRMARALQEAFSQVVDCTVILRNNLH